jgi:hypothetical protein
VFDFSAKVGALPDGRQSPRHHGKKIFDAVFLGAACQFPAVHRIETECQRGALSKRIRPSVRPQSLGHRHGTVGPSLMSFSSCKNSQHFCFDLIHLLWNDKLDDLSQAAVDKDLQETQKFLTRFEAIDTSGFPEQEALNKTLMVRDLKIQLAFQSLGNARRPAERYPDFVT